MSGSSPRAPRNSDVEDGSRALLRERPRGRDGRLDRPDPADKRPRPLDRHELPPGRSHDEDVAGSEGRRHRNATLDSSDVDETPYRLAYEASVRAIEDQARVLEDLRSRAATLVAAAALVTSFLGGTTLTGPL